ncbi:MAG TPA: family 78 glycoside hydrolase catalytic domain, partial [Flavisolibacter sp.]
KKGDNAVGIILGNGMYNIKPDRVRYVKFLNSFGLLKAIAQLRLTYKDGTVETVATDASWKASKGPVTFNNVFAGEDYDARLVQAGWDAAGFVTDASWKAVTVTAGPGGKLKGLSCSAPPIKAIDTLKAVKANEVKPRVWIYDFGQNASMMPRLKVAGPAGSSVRVIPTELLGKDGLADRASATQDGVRPAWWQYTLSGKGAEEWFPKFFYQGARYLQVELYAAKEGGALPKIELLEDVIVHSSSTPIGTFQTSNELFNRIYGLVRWAQRSNMMSLMTDCPQREKLGWLEEAHLNGPALRYNFDMAPLFRKAMQDMADAQLDTGFIPNIAPEYFIASTKKLTDGFRNSPEWGSAFIIVPWQQYIFSGDISLLKTYYKDMKRYVAFLASSAKANILTAGLGDWYDLGPKPPWGSQLTPVPYTATAIYYYDNWIMSRIAKLLGNESDAATYAKAADNIRDAFNKEFYKPETGQYATGSQTCNAMALYLNLAAPEHRPQLVEAIVADIRKRGNGLTSGDVGYRFLLKALAEEGRSDVIFDMNNQSEKPGYGYQLKMGATSLTEKWDASVGNFGSQNHFMLGQINEWFFNDLVGISSDESSAGFKKIIIRPAVLETISWVKGSFQSINGTVVSEYRQEGRKLMMKVSIPPNTTATVFVPAGKASVTESGKPAAAAKGVKFVRTENGRAVYELGSGEYAFQSEI